MASPAAAGDSSASPSLSPSRAKPCTLSKRAWRREPSGAIACASIVIGTS